MSPANAVRAYATRTILFMTGYVAANIAAIFGAFDDLQPPGTYAFALTVAAPIAGQIWATLAYMRDADEFVGRLLAKRFIIAAGVAMALFSAWGFLESYAGVAHAPGWLIYPLFWALLGVITPLVRSTAR